MNKIQPIVNSTSRGDSMKQIAVENKHIKIGMVAAITVILWLMTMSYTLATWKTEMEANHKEFDDRITHVGEKVVDMRADINTLNTKANERDIQLATINAKLANIETLLLEIKMDLKETR